MTVQSKIVKIELRRAEGSSKDCGKWYEFSTWEGANKKLSEWSNTAPEDGGYDICDFKLTFDDDDEYEGSYDLKHWSCDQSNEGGKISLAHHVKGFLKFVSGERPAWMSVENWHQTRLMYADSEEEARQWLQTKLIPA